MSNFKTWLIHILGGITKKEADAEYAEYAQRQADVVWMVRTLKDHCKSISNCDDCDLMSEIGCVANMPCCWQVQIDE